MEVNPYRKRTTKTNMVSMVGVIINPDNVDYSNTMDDRPLVEHDN